MVSINEQCTIKRMTKILRKYLLFLCCLISIQSSLFAQNNRAALDEIAGAIRSNRVQEIWKYFDNFVPITINNNQSNYSHNQAQQVLRDFFDKNPPREFKVMDSGAPTPSSPYLIASFNSPNGKYIMYVLLKQKDANSYQIKEIRLTKE